MLSLLWQICDNIGLIFIVANGQILKNNPTIWSHYTVGTADFLIEWIGFDQTGKAYAYSTKAHQLNPNKINWRSAVQ